MTLEQLLKELNELVENNPEILSNRVCLPSIAYDGLGDDLEYISVDNNIIYLES